MLKYKSPFFGRFARGIGAMGIGNERRILSTGDGYVHSEGISGLEVETQDHARAINLRNGLDQAEMTACLFSDLFNPAKVVFYPGDKGLCLSRGLKQM